jgi:hypothetical protein
MNKVNQCQDCGREVNEHEKFCSRCLAMWHLDNEVDDDAPCADFDDNTPSMHGEGEY